MKKTTMTIPSLGLLILNGWLLTACSAQPPPGCQGNHTFNTEYLFELSCNYDGTRFKHEGVSHIKLVSTDDMLMTSDVDDITFIPTTFIDHDQSCERRTSQISYIQALFYNLKLDNKEHDIHANLECEPLDTMVDDKLVTEPQTANCAPTESDPTDPPPLTCVIKLVPKR